MTAAARIGRLRRRPADLTPDPDLGAGGRRDRGVARWAGIGGRDARSDAMPDDDGADGGDGGGSGWVEDRPWTQGFACGERPLDRERRQVSSRGWLRRGGGATGWVHPVPEYQGTTVQVCGLWMFGVVPANPAIGVPVGVHELTGEMVCADPMAWFEHGIVSSPSLLVFGLNGLGKSSFMKRLSLGWSYQDIVPIVCSDVKGEHVALMRALGGSSVSVGQGEGSINVLDISGALAAADRLAGDVADPATAARLARKVRTQASDTRHTVMCGLIAISRGQPLADWERGLMATALDVLDAEFAPGEAVIADLVGLIERGTDELRDQVATRAEPAEYTAFTKTLVRSLKALSVGSLGKTFAGAETIPVDISRPLSIDISGIGKQDETLRAAVMLACWAKVMLDVEVRHTLADGGLEPRQRFALIFEEMWHILTAASGMVARLNELTRLNRTFGTGQVFTIHSLADLSLLPSEQDRRMAQGFAERSAIMCIFGVPRKELAAIREVVRLSDFEAQRLVGWGAESSIDPTTGRAGAPPGLGRFLLKAGSRPGVAVRFEQVAEEVEYHNTSERWETGP